jgi:hypothetical protein
VGSAQAENRPLGAVQSSSPALFYLRNAGRWATYLGHIGLQLYFEGYQPETKVVPQDDQSIKEIVGIRPFEIITGGFGFFFLTFFWSSLVAGTISVFVGLSMSLYQRELGILFEALFMSVIYLVIALFTRWLARGILAGSRTWLILAEVLVTLVAVGVLMLASIQELGDQKPNPVPWFLFVVLGVATIIYSLFPKKRNS